MTHCTVHLITSLGELMTLQEEWNTLVALSAAPTIFLTWEWIASWLDTVHPEARLFVITVRNRDGHLVAIAPFYQARFTLFSSVEYNTLRFLGDCHSGAEYPDIIVKPECEETALSGIAACLQKHRELWDCAWFPNIASWCGALQRLGACFAEENLLFSRTSSRVFSSVALPDSWEKYMARFSSQRRSLLRRQERKARKTHKLDVRMCIRREDVSTDLEQLFMLHGKRWQAAGESGAFIRRPLMTKFYRAMAPCALDRGWLALFTLSVDGTVMAAQYGYVYNAVFSQVQEGFDPEGPVGLGNILRQHVIRWCIDQGLREYDFLGGHTRHKQQWGGEARQGHNLFAGRKCMKNLLFSLMPVWPTGRYVDQGIPATCPQTLA